MVRTAGRLALASALVLSLLATPALARAQAMVICNVGGPGSTAQAKPVLEKFLRHMEASAGLKKNSLSGSYFTELSDCERYVAEKKPLLGVFELGAYLKQGKAWKLRPLAHMGKADARSYHLLVRKGTFTKPAELKGKTLISVVDDPVYAGKVLLGGKLDPAGDFKKVKTTGRPLKALRNVARGKQDAALVDQMAYEHMGELKLPAELVSIYQSSGLPGLTLAALGVNEKGQDKLVGKIIKALPKLCAGEGKKMCETFQIDAFNKAKPGVYSKLQKTYGK